MFKRLLALIPCAVLLAACGSGGDDHTPTIGDPNTPPPTTNPPPSGPTIGSVVVQTSSPQISSNGSATAEITAYVRGASNQFLEEVPVTFSSTSGGLTITQGTTDAGGIARATLIPAGDPANRSITVTATAGTISGTVIVDVVGTQLSISGPSSLAQNDVGNYVVSLLDSGGGGISGRTINLASARSNTLSATSVTTNAAGQGTFTMTAANGGADTITATSLGLTATHATSVSVDQFAFSTPAANAEVALNTPTPVTVRWAQAGVPQVGQTVTFASTRGTLSASTAVTNGAGDATVSVQSTNAGFGTLSASAAGGITTQRTIEFVASTPATIEVQASPFTIATQESSTITAVVRDATNNPVKNQTVVFSLSDVTGGQLSVASAVTDSQGRAQSTYTAGSATSATNGVVVTASVQGSAVTPDTAAITVGRREVFISLGTGNEITEPNTAQYEIEYAVQVTDASGTGVANTALTLEILSLDYRKGSRTFVQGSGWQTPSNTVCADEDVDRDGILDTGEDLNGSGRIEAGNIATVTPRNVTTDANGFALVKVVYPQEYSVWVNARLSAATAVQGSEFARSVTFLLPGLASDFNSATTSPPGVVSPFGVNACTTPN